MMPQKMQVPHRHLPIVGLIGLVVVAAAGGGIYYYQFVLPHNTACLPPVHRLIFMRAIVQELGGFSVTNAAILNGTSMPKFDESTGANLTGISYQNYKLPDANNKTINGNVGDIITFYIHSVSAPSPPQYTGITGHGFTFSNTPQINGTAPNILPFGQWRTITFTVTSQGTYGFLCTIACSDMHPSMNSAVVVGCS